MIEITKNKIDADAVLSSVFSKGCGANLLFMGTTRNLTEGRETIRLAYECYEAMAIKELNNLCERALSNWPIERISAVHRIGIVEVGEASIAVAVSSPHRQAAFEAAQWFIDSLKMQVPIWKQEHASDGSTEWVHPDVTKNPPSEAPQP